MIVETLWSVVGAAQHVLTDGFDSVKAAKEDGNRSETKVFLNVVIGNPGQPNIV